MRNPSCGRISNTAGSVDARPGDGPAVSRASPFGGGARYAAVLADRPERDVERATAVGFFVGFGIAILILAIDALT